MAEMHSTRSVKQVIEAEVPDWDDQVLVRSRFKAFSGQKSEWLPRYVFWKDLIITVARHLRLISINPAEVKNVWFLWEGLTPLCLDHVFSLMYDEGYFLRSMDLPDPRSGGVSRLFRRVRNLVVTTGLMTTQIMLEDNLFLVPLLKERASEAIKSLCERYWTSHCIITMKQFQIVCGGSSETQAILSYLVGCAKAQYLWVKKDEVFEGVKVSLTEASIAKASTLDYDILHLVCTSEKLAMRITAIEERYQSARKSALLSLKSGDKKVALRYAKELKLISESRVKWTALLSNVDGMLDAIADAGTTKNVAHAIQIGKQAIKKHEVSVEDVEHCLEELSESLVSQKQLEHALESSSFFMTVEEDEEIEASLQEIQLELDFENHEQAVQQVEDASPSGKSTSPLALDLMSHSFSNLKVEDDENITTRKSTPRALEPA